MGIAIGGRRARLSGADAHTRLTLIGAFGVGVLASAVFFAVGVVLVDGRRTIEVVAVATIAVVGLLALRLTDAGASARAAVRAVSSRERRLSTITETLNDVVFISDGEGQMVFVSESIKRVFGVDAEEFLERPISERVHPDDLPQYLLDATYLRTTPNGTVHVELRIEVADGDWRWLDVRGLNLLDHPDLQGVITSVQDVTERRAVLEALRDSEERFRSLADSSPVGVCRLRGDGSVEYVNRQALDILELPEDALIGPDRASVVEGAWASHDPGIRGRLQQAYLAALDGVEKIGDVEYLTPTGATRWLDLRVRMLGDGTDGTGGAAGAGGRIITIEDVTDKRTASTRLLHQATHDQLTGLPNRRLLLESLSEAMDRADEEVRLLAVLFCDLDLFKVVNDSLGHDIGDQLLLAVAGRFAAVLHTNETLARFGGDEFVVVCDGLTTADDADLLAHRLVESLREPVAVGEHRIKVSTSIGVALRRLDHDRADALIRDADLAMYQAKESGRNRVAVFDDSLRARAVRRMELEQGLRVAMERDELELAYQPTVSLGDGRITGVEALLRWTNPVYGEVPPDEFVIIAEEIGFVVDLDEWVLAESCRQLTEWQSTFGLGDFTMSVNLSGRHLVRHDLVASVRQAVSVNALDPACLTLEITETAVMADAETSIGVLDALKRIGVRLAVDDFGTGYSSLSYLRRLPVDVLKIDRTFVNGLGRDVGDTEIVRLVVTLAGTLGLATVAEGVETVGQLDELTRLGCDMAQGFLLWRPMPAEDVSDLLADRDRYRWVNPPSRRRDDRPPSELDA